MHGKRYDVLLWCERTFGMGFETWHFKGRGGKVFETYSNIFWICLIFITLYSAWVLEYAVVPTKEELRFSMCSICDEAYWCLC